MVSVGRDGASEKLPPVAGPTFLLRDGIGGRTPRPGRLALSPEASHPKPGRRAVVVRAEGRNELLGGPVMPVEPTVHGRKRPEDVVLVGPGLVGDEGVARLLPEVPKHVLNCFRHVGG